MVNFVGIVEYEVGDKVRYINPSDFSIEVTKVDTSAILTITEVELIEHPNMSYQICTITDGKGSTFTSGLELMPADPDELKMWEELKKNAKKSRRSSSKGKTKGKVKQVNKVNTDIAASSIKSLNIKVNKK